ncbi:MAG: class I SAM-dependent methyltransferase [Cyclobacteriaceae bacterium]|nr:class I SAM-dependent methyltransferase [Cyclobacteriaceae bacterium]
MDRKEITYRFVYADRCNMCGRTDFNVLGKRLNQHQGRNPKQKIGITTTVVQCRACGLIFANPLPIPQRIADHYEVPVDLYFGEQLKEIPETYFQHEINTFKAIYPARASMRGLDIGTGLGGVMKALIRNDVDAYGLEPSKSFYEYALTRGFPSDRLFNQSLEEASFPDSFFDLILFSAVFEHLYDPNQALVTALRWLKPGGLVYIGVPSNRIFVQLLANLFYRLRGMDYVSNISPMHAPFHLYEFGKETFEKNAQLNNYSIAQVDFWTTHDYVFAKPNPVIKIITKLTRTDMNMILWLRKN